MCGVYIHICTFLFKTITQTPYRSGVNLKHKETFQSIEYEMLMAERIKRYGQDIYQWMKVNLVLSAL